MKKDLYKDMRLFLQAIIAVSLFLLPLFVCSFWNSRRDNLSWENKLHRYPDDYQRRNIESGEE